MDELCIWWLLWRPPSSGLIICWVGTPGTQESTLFTPITDLLQRIWFRSRQLEETPGADVEGGVGAAVLSPGTVSPAPGSIRQPRVSWTLSCRGFYESRFPAHLMRSLAIGGGESPVCVCSPAPGLRDTWRKVPVPSSCLGLSGNQLPSWRSLGDPSLSQNRGHYYHSGNSGGSGSHVSGAEDKDQIYLFTTILYRVLSLQQINHQVYRPI